MPAIPSSNPRAEAPADFFAKALSTLSGVAEKQAKLLKRLKLETYQDLIFHLPVSLVDRRRQVPLSEVKPGDIITVRVAADEHQPVPHPSSRRPYRIRCSNDTGELVLVFFHVKGDYLQKLLPIGEPRVVSGRVEAHGDGLSMPHPDYIVPPAREAEVLRIEPVYPLTYGVTNKLMQYMLRKVLPLLPALPEWLDAELKRQRGWPDWRQAVTKLHTPEKMDDLEPDAPARMRLAYDELLAHQLAMALARRRHTRENGQVLKGSGQLVEALLKTLPFMLTKGQQEVLAELKAEMESGHKMVRLLQGDVGSGKTIVALCAMLQAIAAGAQGALMAPTEILARQHYAVIHKLLEPLGVRVVLLTGQSKAKTSIHKAIREGLVQMVIGTHALLEQAVAFKRLGLAVIDEQHRFGVQQRLQLIGKTAGAHVLLMSATPIPRTLALTCYGDMALSVLKEKPAGRQPIETRAMPLSRLQEIVEGLGRIIAQGSRIYWVCPLVEESEELDLAAAEQRYAEIKRYYPRIGLVHGRMKFAERDPVMQAFRQGALDILIATTVIEVGVDVPEASVMIIEHAERFGLSQLHQLRGRVGRGAAASSCLLLYADNAGKTARERLRIMRETEDGFKIAEEDMRLRGIGDMIGSRQSGFPEFRHADLAVHAPLLTIARDDAAYILHQDAALSSPRGEALRQLLSLYGYSETEIPMRIRG